MTSFLVPGKAQQEIKDEDLEVREIPGEPFSISCPN
jgi:hypothetical protein